MSVHSFAGIVEFHNNQLKLRHLVAEWPRVEYCGEVEY